MRYKEREGMAQIDLVFLPVAFIARSIMRIKGYDQNAILRCDDQMISMLLDSINTGSYRCSKPTLRSISARLFHPKKEQ